MSQLTSPQRINHYQDNRALRANLQQQHYHRHHQYHQNHTRLITITTSKMPNLITSSTTRKNRQPETKTTSSPMMSTSRVIPISSASSSSSSTIFYKKPHEILIKSSPSLIRKNSSRSSSVSRGSLSLISIESLISRNKNNSKQAAFFASRVHFTLISTLFILTFLSAILLDHQVYSLKCYHCSSVDNPNCDETFTAGENSTLHENTDCEKHIGREAKVCRKLVHYIEHKKVVIRSCGWLDEPTSSAPGADKQANIGGDASKERKPMCYKRSGTFAIMTEACNCYTDNCNHSNNLKPTQSVLFLSSSLLLASFGYLIISKSTLL